MDQKFTIVLTQSELQVLSVALSELPFKAVVNIINSINGQIQQQLTEPPAKD